MIKVNNADLYDRYKNYIDLELNESDPDIFFITSEIQEYLRILGYRTSGESKQVKQEIIKEYRNLVRLIRTFFDEHRGKSALINSKAVFSLMGYLVPEKFLSIYEVNQHLIPHKLLCIDTNKKYNVHSNHNILFESPFIIPKYICSPAVSTFKNYLNSLGKSLPHHGRNEDEVEVFHHVYKSITFCIPDLLSKDTDIEFGVEILKLTKNYKVI